MYCKNCGKSLRDKSNFCANCGEKVIIDEKINNDEMYCRNCGKSIKKDSKICSKCGYHLNKSLSSSDTFESIVIVICSFLIPLVGLVIWLILRKENNINAKRALVAGFVGFSLFVLSLVLLLIFLYVVVFNYR